MTAKDQDGKVIHTERRKYDNWNLWFEGGKEVELRVWDITATTNVNLGLEPEQPDKTTHVLLVDPGTKSATIEVRFLYEEKPDYWVIIKKATKTVNFESADKYFK